MTVEELRIADGSADAMAALERFVVDNDELLELEERIGRFNIFDALRIVDREVKHSDFLAWLLDPNDSHGQGGLFLRAILMDLFKTARENGFACPASPIELDGEDLRGVEVRREWKNIDLLVRCQEPNFVIAIENKIKSGEHSDQLNRYRQTVEGEFGRTPSMYVFLTVEGDEPSEEDWVPYSYGDIHRVLLRVRNANESSIGEDVLAFLDHYLRLLRGRLMDDPKIDELCQTIYKNHRQAIDLIFERTGAGGDLVAHIVEEVVKARPEEWTLISRTRRDSINVIPTSWLKVLPPISASPKFAKCIPEGKRAWLYACFYPEDVHWYVSVWPRPTTDDALRAKVLQRLTKSRDEFGFKLPRRGATAEWPTLLRQQMFSIAEDEDIDSDAFRQKAVASLDKLLKRFAGVPDALRPIIAEWEASQANR